MKTWNESRKTLLQNTWNGRMWSRKDGMKETSCGINWKWKQENPVVELIKWKVLSGKIHLLCSMRHRNKLWRKTWDEIQTITVRNWTKFVSRGVKQDNSSPLPIWERNWLWKEILNRNKPKTEENWCSIEVMKEVKWRQRHRSEDPSTSFKYFTSPNSSLIRRRFKLFKTLRQF